MAGRIPRSGQAAAFESEYSALALGDLELKTRARIRRIGLLEMFGAVNMGSRLFAIMLFSVVAIAPLIIWMFLWAITESLSAKLRAVLPWIKMVRWVAWSGSIVLFIVYIIVDHLQHFPIFAIAMSSFSAGLSLPENWLKRKPARTG